MRFVDIFEILKQLLFPIACVGCGRPQTYICQACIAKIPRAQESQQKFIHAVFSYKDTHLRSVVRKFKYNNARMVATYFGEHLYNELLGILSDRLDASNHNKIILVPIPLHERRKRERGYNQSELLTQAILFHDTHKVFDYAPNILTRNHYTPPQAKKEVRAERFTNLRDVFDCDNPEYIQGNIVVLIDDVTTTGATFSEARRALLVAKPRAIIALALAH